jgi:hypothetical protein
MMNNQLPLWTRQVLTRLPRYYAGRKKSKHHYNEWFFATTIGGTWVYHFRGIAQAAIPWMEALEMIRLSSAATKRGRSYICLCMVGVSPPNLDVERVDPTRLNLHQRLTSQRCGPRNVGLYEGCFVFFKNQGLHRRIRIHSLIPLAGRRSHFRRRGGGSQGDYLWRERRRLVRPALPRQTSVIDSPTPSLDQTALTASNC